MNRRGKRMQISRARRGARILWLALVALVIVVAGA
jgi:hypothetical protein